MQVYRGAEVKSAFAPVPERRQISKHGRFCHSSSFKQRYAEISDIQAGEFKWAHIQIHSHAVNGEIGLVCRRFELVDCEVRIEMLEDLEGGE